MTNNQTGIQNELDAASYTIPEANGWLACEPSGGHAFDLEERTARFAESVIGFARTVVVTPVSRPLIGQLVRAATSVGANYVEANDTETRKDFRYKIGLCKREAKEMRYWLRLLVTAEPEGSNDIAQLADESRQLILIFVSILRNTAEQAGE